MQRKHTKYGPKFAKTDFFSGLKSGRGRCVKTTGSAADEDLQQAPGDGAAGSRPNKKKEASGKIPKNFLSSLPVSKSRQVRSIIQAPEMS